MRQSQRLAAVQTPVITVVGEMIRATPGTISLGQGVVHFAPPPQALQRIGQFLEDPEQHKYKATEGIPPLLEACAAKLRAENGIVADPTRHVVITAGANMGFENALLAIADPGDEIILLTPYYFNHEMAIVMASCTPVLVATDDHYQPRLDAIAAAITSRTRAILTISPNNPSGAVYPESTLSAINTLCAERGIYHICDEPYEYFTYGGARHFSPGSISGSAEHTISLFSLSKAYGFASWRIGYMVVPEHLMMAVKKIQETILICPPVVSQFAALGALEAGAEYFSAYKYGFVHMRQLVLNELEPLADICTIPAAQGAFYMFLHVRSTLPSMELITRLLYEYRVAVMPGMAFGMNDDCYIRVAYGALREETVAEGCERLVRGLRAIVGGNN